MWTISEKMLATQKYVSENDLTYEASTQKEVQEREMAMDSSAHPKTVCGNLVKTSVCWLCYYVYMTDLHTGEGMDVWQVSTYPGGKSGSLSWVLMMRAESHRMC